MCDNGENYYADEDMISLRVDHASQAIQKHGDNNLSHLIMSTTKIFTLLQLSDFVQQLLAFLPDGLSISLQIYIYKIYSINHSILLINILCVEWFQFYN